MDALRQRAARHRTSLAPRQPYLARQRPRRGSGRRLRLLQGSRCAKTHTKRTCEQSAVPLPTSCLYSPEQDCFVQKHNAPQIPLVRATRTTSASSKCYKSQHSKGPRHVLEHAKARLIPFKIAPCPCRTTTSVAPPGGKCKISSTASSGVPVKNKHGTRAENDFQLWILEKRRLFNHASVGVAETSHAQHLNASTVNVRIPENSIVLPRYKYEPHNELFLCFLVSTHALVTVSLSSVCLQFIRWVKLTSDLHAYGATDTNKWNHTESQLPLRFTCVHAVRTCVGAVGMRIGSSLGMARQENELELLNAVEATCDSIAF